MKLKTTEDGVNIELTANEARYLKEELGDLPLKRGTMMKLIQLYRQLDSHFFQERDDDELPQAQA
jgi:hypothetical protein